MWSRKKRLRLVDRRPAREVRVSSAADLEEFAHWGDRRVKLRLLLPAEMATMHGGFRFGGGWNPFVEALESGAESLAWYYDRHQPKSLRELHFLPASTVGPDLAPAWRIPWIGSVTEPTGEKGLALEEGMAYFGPCSREKLELEMRRLEGTRDSIQRNGFQPDHYGDLNGCILKRGGDLVFFIRGGKHRAAVLASLGRAEIPVAFKPGWPRVVDRASCESWPLVRSGELGLEIARGVVDAYLDQDGSQQRRLLDEG
jgi:hypothetical protein